MSRRARRAAATSAVIGSAVIGKVGVTTRGQRTAPLTEEPGIVIEIDYDGADAPPPRRSEERHVDGNIKSAIIRWLNEAL